jgi:hypothetical protein
MMVLLLAVYPYDKRCHPLTALRWQHIEWGPAVFCHAKDAVFCHAKDNPSFCCELTNAPKELQPGVFWLLDSFLRLTVDESTKAVI